MFKLEEICEELSQIQIPMRSEKLESIGIHVKRRVLQTGVAVGAGHDECKRGSFWTHPRKSQVHGGIKGLENLVREVGK